MKRSTFRAIYVFVIPFIFIWIGAQLANAFINNTIFEIILGIVMLLGIFLYWLMPFIVAEIMFDELEKHERQKKLKNLIKNNPHLSKKFSRFLEEKEIENETN